MAVGDGNRRREWQKRAVKGKTIKWWVRAELAMKITEMELLLRIADDESLDYAISASAKWRIRDLMRRQMYAGK